jgi:uncharacterized protein YkuJ
MSILFESNTEKEEEFEYDGKTIINKGTVKFFASEEEFYEALA